METKLPRAVLGVLVGAAFGLGGAIFQTTLRNALASPDVIGVSMGASAAAVFAIVTLGLQGPAVSAFAIAGALGVSLVVRLVAGAHGGYRIVLVGVGSRGLPLRRRAVPLHPREHLRRPGRARLADRQPGPRQLGADRPARARPGRAAPAGRVARRVTAADRARPGHRDRARVLAAAHRRADAARRPARQRRPSPQRDRCRSPASSPARSPRPSTPAAPPCSARCSPEPPIVTAADYVGAYLIADLNLPVGVVTGACGAPFLLWLLATGRTTRSS